MILQKTEGLAGILGIDQLGRAIANHFANRLALPRVVLNDEQLPGRRFAHSSGFGEDVFDRGLVNWLGQCGDRTMLQRVLRSCIRGGNDEDRNVPCGQIRL